MEKRVSNAIDVFLNAIKEGTLVKGICTACAVGNLVAHGLGCKIVKDNEGGLILDNEDQLLNSCWKLLFMTGFKNQRINKHHINNKDVKNNIEATEFTWKELAKIEYIFETNSEINYSDYENHTPSQILDDQIKGLEAVIEVMLSFSNDTKTNVKEVFTNKVLTH